jgi:hypothetical protein
MIKAMLVAALLTFLDLAANIFIAVHGLYCPMCPRQGGNVG